MATPFRRDGFPCQSIKVSFSNDHYSELVSGAAIAILERIIPLGTIPHKQVSLNGENSLNQRFYFLTLTIAFEFN
jgi:hypothetical protein